ncbi:MAG TPA: SdrD B-like domain-containing protein, partial [Methanothrix sp.]|nr:SdrD B-like domain-containing protein [Methanothrix sp.]
MDGVYEDEMTLPQYSEPGTWKLDYISLSDSVGNRKRLSEDDIAASGFPTEFEVESVGDVEPPDVLSFDFDPKAVDTSTSSQEITATAHLTDDLSGFSSASVWFESPSDGQSVGVSLSFNDRISGDELDGIYEDEMTLPQYSEPGTWKLDYISLSDSVGNRKRLSQDDAKALGFPTEFEVESLGDAKPPDVLSFDFDPKAVDTSTSSQEITATAHLTDDLSGFSSASVWFESPSDGQSVGVSLSSNDRISGDELDGVYVDTMTLPQYSEPGTWKLDYISLTDSVGNRKRLSGDDAAALGFPTTFRNGHSGDFFISGMKFNDTNNNTIKDPLEIGLSGWTIELLLDGEVIDVTETGQDGSYSFDHLAPGNYTVREVRQAGWLQTSPPGGSHTVTLTGADSVGNNFGNHKTEPVDTKPPEIISFDFNPKEIDAWNSSQEITIIANISDDLSGFKSSEMRFYSPSGDQYVDGEIVNLWIIFPPPPFDLVRRGTYDTKIEVPRYSEKGTWEISYLTLVDNAGNEVRLEKDDLKALGFPIEFKVVSECDKEPPNILSFDINPSLIDTSNSSQEITVTAHLTDDLSGLTSAESCFSNPSGWLICCHGAGCYQHSEDDWCYERKIEYSQGSSEGTWELRSFNFEDAVGNKRQLSKEEMEDLGFPTEFRNLPLNKRFPGLKIEKNASSSIVAPGGLVNYTIIYTNTGDVDLTDVVITERYPAGVEFISASPEPDPGTNNRWTVGDLPALEKPRKIAVTVRFSELQDLELAGDGQIVGEGFVNARGSLSTSRGPLELKNVVTITSAETGPVSAAASVKVDEPGTELETREHGSGSYESE